MIVIVDISPVYFSLNGIRYFKNFTPLVQGQKVSLVNTFDNRIVLYENKNISEITIDGDVYTDIEEFQEILLPVVYAKNAGTGTGIENITEIPNRSYNDLQDLPLFIPDRVLAQTNITGSYVLDWSLYEVWDLVLTGNSTLTNSNLVNGKTIKILISGSFTLNLTAFNSVKGTYNGAIKNLIVASNINNYLSLTINPAD
jgi:hypothetical protein